MREIKAGFPGYIEGAAFYVDEYTIVKVNADAEECGICVGDDVRDLIYTGFREYANFEGGMLYLELQINNERRAAAVMIEKAYHLFCLLKQYDNAELKAMALAGHILLKPLQESLVHIKLLEHSLSNLEDETTENIDDNSLKRNLFQMLRSIHNMMDASTFSTVRVEKFNYQDVSEIFDAMGRRLTTMEKALKHKFRYTGLHKQLYTMADAQALERAFYNMISNAVKFSPEGSTITVKLAVTKKRLLITVSNQRLPGGIREEQFFNRYLRQPMPENSQIGIGLGMTVIRTIASAHKGTLFVHPESERQMSVTMSLGIQNNTESRLRASSMRMIPAGGYDTALVELSDVLPADMYDKA